MILCVGYLGEMIQKRYGDGEALGVRIRYSFDGPKLLGTGGAIKKASAFLPDVFFVLYGDSYLPVDYQAVAAAFREAGKPALMTVFANSDAWTRAMSGLSKAGSVSIAREKNYRKCTSSITA